MRDTYNYVTVQTDIAIPKRQISIVEDAVRQTAWQAAIQQSVEAIVSEDKDCRVLDLAAGAGPSHCFFYVHLSSFLCILC